MGAALRYRDGTEMDWSTVLALVLSSCSLTHGAPHYGGVGGGGHSWSVQTQGGAGTSLVHGNTPWTVWGAQGSLTGGSHTSVSGNWGLHTGGAGTTVWGAQRPQLGGSHHGTTGAWGSQGGGSGTVIWGVQRPQTGGSWGSQSGLHNTLGSGTWGSKPSVTGGHELDVDSVWGAMSGTSSYQWAHNTHGSSSHQSVNFSFTMKPQRPHIPVKPWAPKPTAPPYIPPQPTQPPYIPPQPTHPPPVTTAPTTTTPPPPLTTPPPTVPPPPPSLPDFLLPSPLLPLEDIDLPTGGAPTVQRPPSRGSGSPLSSLAPPCQQSNTAPPCIPDTVYILKP